MNPLLITLYLSVFAYKFSASQVPVGKIIYQMQGTTDLRGNIEMLFSNQHYIYSFGKSDFELFIEQKKGKYTNVKDSLEDAERLRNEKMQPQTWYGELATNVVINSFYYPNTGKIYCITDTLTFMKWELMPDTMTVRGIFCQKASGKYKNMEYTAWFAPSIPVSTAPLQFRGLPGLLIECTNNTKKLTLGMIELEWPAKQSVALAPCSGVGISRFDMNKLIEKNNARGKYIYEMIKQAQKEGKTVNIKDVIKD